MWVFGVLVGSGVRVGRGVLGWPWRPGWPGNWSALGCWSAAGVGRRIIASQCNILLAKVLVVRAININSGPTIERVWIYDVVGSKVPAGRNTHVPALEKPIDCSPVLAPLLNCQ